MGASLDADMKLVLEEVSVMTGNRITPTAVVRLKVNGEIRVGSGSGVGPVDAALKALENSLGEYARVTLKEYRLNAITGGADALAEVIVGVEDTRGRRVTARAAREDIVMASVEAMVGCINRLLIMP
jgi:2-isopropylmalate synthase